MKFNIVKYFSVGDYVTNKRTGQQGTVIRSGHHPIVTFVNELGMRENRRISGKYLKLTRPLNTFVNKKIHKVKTFLNL